MVPYSSKPVSGVTGRLRSDVTGATTQCSSIELRPHRDSSGPISGSRRRWAPPRDESLSDRSWSQWVDLNHQG
jgi:hypothetical protein